MINEYVAQPMNAWFMWFFGIGAIGTCFLWLTFAQFTMRRIEKQFKQDGAPVGFLWDGLGGRIVFYAYAILFPERCALRIERLINVRLVRSYATKADWWRSCIFVITSHMWLGVVFLSLALGLNA